MRAASKHKKLRIHNGSHVHPFYTEEGKRDQLRFLDYWLKGIDNGVMDEPPVKLAIRKGKDEIEWRARARMAARAHAVDQVLFRHLDGRRRQGAARRQRWCARSRPRPVRCTYPAFNLGTMGSTSAASSQVMGGGIKPGMGIALSTPPLDRGHRDHRAARRDVLCVERERGHGPVPDAPQFRRRRQRDHGDRPAGHAGAGGEGLAARLAPRARSGVVAAVPAVSQAHAAAVSEARRDRQGRRRNLADLDDVQEGPPHPARRAAARRRRQPVAICTITPTTTPAPTRSTRAANTSRICCCR